MPVAKMRDKKIESEFLIALTDVLLEPNADHDRVRRTMRLLWVMIMEFHKWNVVSLDEDAMKLVDGSASITREDYYFSIWALDNVAKEYGPNFELTIHAIKELRVLSYCEIYDNHTFSLKGAKEAVEYMKFREINDVQGLSTRERVELVRLLNA